MRITLWTLLLGHILKEKVYSMGHTVFISGICPCRPLLMDRPDIVVGTPSKILAHVKAGNLQLRDSIEMVVVDEADLVFSFGYETDMKTLLR